jgi:hypothetical protein
MWSMFWIWRHFVTIDSCIIVILSILHMWTIWTIWTCAIMDNTIELLEWKWYQCTQISHNYISDCTFVKSDLGEYAFKFWQEDVLVWLNLFFLTWTVTSLKILRRVYHSFSFHKIWGISLYNYMQRISVLKKNWKLPLRIIFKNRNSCSRIVILDVHLKERRKK